MIRLDLLNILIVRKHNQIGDMLSSLPLYAAVKNKYPSCSITLVASQTNYPIPFKDINPYIDEVLIYDKSSLKSILSFYYRLRKKKFAFGIVPSTINLSRSSHIINFISGAVKRIGVNSIDGIPNKTAFLLNIKGDFNWDREKKHQSERNLEIAELIGCTLTEEEKIIPLQISINDRKEASEFINQNFNRGSFILGIHPGAGKAANIWNYKNFIEVIDNINSRTKTEVLLTCSNIDKSVVDLLTAELQKINIKYFTANNFSVLKLASIFELLDLYITNDTGPMHIAGKTNVNQISLFGPTNIFEWGPIGQNKINIQSPSKQINDISTETVINLILPFLRYN